MNLSVTVAICTWNRASLLDQTLERMKCLRIPHGVTWELLVVNNNSTDNTDEVIAKHTSHLPIRRLLELKQGHSNARNCAVQEARGELLLWTDDDVLVDPDWVIEYLRAEKEYPDAGYFGGTIEPWFEIKPPEWILKNLDKLEGAFAVRQLGVDIRPLSKGEEVYGANLGFRTALLRDIPFDPKLGRIGTGMLSGDETIVMDRMREKGLSGVWVGTARVRHFIPASRLSVSFIRNYYRGLGQTAVRAGYIKDDFGTRLWGAPRWWYRVYISQYVRANMRWLLGRDWLSLYLAAMYQDGKIRESRKMFHVTTRELREQIVRQLPSATHK